MALLFKIKQGEVMHHSILPALSELKISSKQNSKDGKDGKDGKDDSCIWPLSTQEDPLRL